MGRKHRSPVTLVALATVLYVGTQQSKLPAQDRGAGGLEIASVEGVLEAAGADRLKLKTEDGKEVFAVFNNQSQFSYTGTADPKFLQPGLSVRFVSAFDVQKGVPVSAISEIEVFRPKQSRRMSQEMRQSQTPGVYPVTDEKAAKDDKSAKGKRAGAGRNASTGAGNAGNQNFRVVGMLRAIQNNRLQIVVGNRPLLVELADDAKITIASADVAFCMPGDKIKVTGLRTGNQEGLLQAETIVIEGAKPLGLPTANAKATRRSRTKRGTADDTTQDSGKAGSGTKKN